MITLKEHNVKPYGELCAMLAKVQKCAYVAATGTGKSYVVGKYIEDRQLASSTLVLVPSREIKHNWEKLVPGVGVMTYQTLCRNKTKADGKKLIVCDEMHHLGAKKWGRVYREAIEGFSGHLIGITATPIRFRDNSRDMAEECFESNIVEGLDLPAAISAGVLPSFEYITALYNLPSRRPDKTGRDEYTEQLFRQLDFMESEYSFQNILRKHLDCGDHKVVVFVNRIENIAEIRRAVEEVYPDAGHHISHSKMKRKDAKEEITRFSEESGMSFIYTVDMLNEGVHIAGADCVIMFRKTESPNIYLQQLGRALANDMADTRVKIFDFVANHRNLKSMQEGSGSVINWIMENITEPKRQIIMRDYVLEEMRVLNMIKNILSGRWQPREDALIVEKYNQPNGLDELESLLPNRTREAIWKRAVILCVAPGKKDYRGAGVYDAVEELYCKENGMQLLKEQFPDVKPSAFAAIANRMGLRRKPPKKEWTAEEDALLAEMDAQRIPLGEQAERLGRTVTSVGGRKHNLGIKHVNRHEWTEEENAILLETAEWGSAEIKAQYFPDLPQEVINRQRKKLGLEINHRKWPEEKNLLFDKLYAEGGALKVLENEMFKGMTREAVKGHAATRKVKSSVNTCIPWTAEEEEILMEYIRMPEEKRPPIYELAERIPRHTYHGVRHHRREMEKKMKEQTG